MRQIVLLIIFLITTSCSLDSRTGVWENKKKMTALKNLEKINFAEINDFTEFKKYVIRYGNISEFPDIND